MKRLYFPLVIRAIALAGIGLGVATDRLQSKPVARSQAAPSLTVADSQAVTALAAHLKKIGAKMYGAYWCPHCTRQKEMFGAAIRSIDYVECDPQGDNPRPKLCQAAKIKGYPTWEINGQLYPGTQSLEELAKASNYKGSKDF